MKVYFCKSCGFTKEADGNNLCPKCCHYMSEQTRDNPWIVKMKIGMQLMREACKENDMWGECVNCPFDEICSRLEEKATADDLIFDAYEPSNWEIE